MFENAFRNNFMGSKNYMKKLWNPGKLKNGVLSIDVFDRWHLLQSKVRFVREKNSVGSCCVPVVITKK